MPDESPRTMTTAEMSWEVVDILQEQNGARVIDIANELDVPKGTAYTHLATLREKGKVIKNGHTYELSLQFLSMGEFVRNNDPLYIAGKEKVDRLAKETNEYVHLVTEDQYSPIYLYGASGEQAVGTKYFTQITEKTSYFHNTAYGKAILAHLPDNDVEEILDRDGLPSKTANTITNREELFNELEQVRERGFALNDEEELRGERAVGAPILDKNDRVQGAVSITKPTSRMQGEEFYEKMPRKVASTADAIAISLQTDQA